MSVDFPAPFWPSRQWTSPGRTSRSTPPRASTPGKRFTMPRISSSGAAVCAAVGAGVDGEDTEGTVACVTHFCRAPIKSVCTPVQSPAVCLTSPVRTGELFDLLRDGRPWTRAQLAEATGLARSTITARIDTLMRLGLVAPFGGARSTGGRPPALFALNPTAKVVVGVDVGATHASAALTDLNGSILGEVDAQIAVADGTEAVLSWVVESVRDLLETSERPAEDLAAIGIGLPGPVEHSTGRPINPPIMPGWDRFDVPAYLQREHAVPVLVD